MDKHGKCLFWLPHSQQSSNAIKSLWLDCETSELGTCQIKICSASIREEKKDHREIIVKNCVEHFIVVRQDLIPVFLLKSIIVTVVKYKTPSHQMLQTLIIFFINSFTKKKNKQYSGN